MKHSVKKFYHTFDRYSATRGDFCLFINWNDWVTFSVMKKEWKTLSSELVIDEFYMKSFISWNYFWNCEWYIVWHVLISPKPYFSVTKLVKIFFIQINAKNLLDFYRKYYNVENCFKCRYFFVISIFVKKKTWSNIENFVK